MVGRVHHERRPLTYSLRAIGPEPRPCSDRASVAWAVTDGAGLFASPWAGVCLAHICRRAQWTETKWQTHGAHRVPVHWDTLMIMDAGLLTVTSVRENNNQRTGSESAVFTPLWNIDMLVSMLGIKTQVKPLSFPRFASGHGARRSVGNDEALRPPRGKTWGSFLVELENQHTLSGFSRTEPEGRSEEN